MEQGVQKHGKAEAPKNAAPFRVLGLDHVVLRVRDLDASLAFYRDLLGCVVERELPEAGLVQLRAGKALIDLVPVQGALGAQGGAAPGPEGRNLDHFCLCIEPFDETALRAVFTIKEGAGEAVQQRYGAEGFGPSLYVQDPDGNTVELKGPAR